MNIHDVAWPLLGILPMYALLWKIGRHDHRTHCIPNRYIGIFVGYAIMDHLFCGQALFIISTLWVLILMLLLPVILSFLLKKSIIFGMGDVKLMAVCALLLPLEQVGYFFSSVGVFGFIYYGFFRTNPMPFAPAIGVAFVVNHGWMMAPLFVPVMEKIITDVWG